MRKLADGCRQVVLALALVLLNGWIVVGVVGLVYRPFQWAAFGGQPYMSEADFPSGCTDGADNDGDAATDCADTDCRSEPECSAPAPIMGSEGIALLVLVLLLVAGVAMRRRPAPDGAGDW